MIEELAKAELCKSAIEAMEACANGYDVVFAISYRGQNKGYVSPYSKKWKVSVLAKIFSDDDFPKAIGKAVEFVIKEKAPHLLNSGQSPEECDASKAESMDEPLVNNKKS